MSVHPESAVMDEFEFAVLAANAEFLRLGGASWFG
jgi:hypothetical protein